MDWMTILQKIFPSVLSHCVWIGYWDFALIKHPAFGDNAMDWMTILCLLVDVCSASSVTLLPVSVLGC